MKLEGVKVLDLSMYLPGPHLTMMLADHGAEVISIEPFSGEPVRRVGLSKGGHSVWFRNTHRGKKSLRINLKDQRGKELLLKLAESADIWVEGFRPGVMQRLGLDYEIVSARAPQIIYCSLSAFGQNGRYRLKPAHDLVMQAMAGVLSFNLGKDGKPTNAHMPVADMSGSMMALSGILMALVAQRQSGKGDYLDIAMHDSVMSWTPNYLGPISAEHRAHVVKHERNWGGAAFYNIYETSDKEWIVLGGVEENFCKAFLEKAGRMDLFVLCCEPPGPVQDPVKAYLSEFFLNRTQHEALDWLDGVDCCYAPLRTLLDGVFDPNTAEREMLLTDDDGVEFLGNPIKFTHDPAEVSFQVPELGEHSREVASDAGYSAADIETLINEKVI